MTMKLEIELLPADRQPKNSYRYGFRKGDAIVESIYIRRSAFQGTPPSVLKVVISED